MRRPLRSTRGAGTLRRGHTSLRAGSTLRRSAQALQKATNTPSRTRLQKTVTIVGIVEYLFEEDAGTVSLLGFLSDDPDGGDDEMQGYSKRPVRAYLTRRERCYHLSSAPSAYIASAKNRVAASGIGSDTTMGCSCRKSIRVGFASP